MKRFLIGFVSTVTLVGFFSFMVSLPIHSALAIDRSSKENKAQEKSKPTDLKEFKEKDLKEGQAKGITSVEKETEKTKPETKEEARVVEKADKQPKPPKRERAKEKYDYFIDKNNNGIDDRLERKKQKQPVSPSTIYPAPKEKKPVKVVPSIKETEKKKIKEAPKKEEVKEARKIEGKKRR
ncbi:MAG: hypothetical protein AMJ73_08175 [candidate division Zixibacteria bacterium SM1_73]|nr:MAG: hypothetical protein AMJ73_08175 [candidate division Zixibacteria bacterium SM1_73]